MSNSTKSHAMRTQYGAWPYPDVPLLARLPGSHPFELNAAWLWDRCGSGSPPVRPRIWIAGCGTFQPYAFALANPAAEIVATDLAEPSLAIARRRCTLHRQKHVRFAPVDLADESTWPDGTFDVIECYGVLMNLADPAHALRRLGERLEPRGVLRLMVYPHWSRARVFQLQRVARLLGLSANRREDPARLRAFVRSLPRRHPLRHAFVTYADSRNDAGVVDAFLHAGDRGFTGHQLGELLVDARLEPAYWFHRPWAQPDVMAARLGLDGRAQTSVLAYLDLWQELRGNFVVCARRADAPTRHVAPPAPHPLFAGARHPLRHRLHLERLRWLGGRLPARTTDEPIALRPADARALRAGDVPPHLSDTPLALGGRDHAPRAAAHEPWAGEGAFLAHAASLRIGRRAPNPLYAHLFAAFEASLRHPELRLPDLEGQMGRWLPWADPLEQRPIAFGLTPYATFQRFRTNVLEHLGRGDLPIADDYASVRVRDDDEARRRVGAMLDTADLPRTARPDGDLRELFVLLCTHDSLFLCLE